MGEEIQDQAMAQMMLPQMPMPQGGYYAKQDGETIRFRLEVEVLIEQMEHDLKGEHLVVEQMKDSEGKPMFDDKGVPALIQIYKKVGVSKCNDYGAKALTGEVRKFIGKNTFLSDMDIDEINMLCRNIGHIITNLVEDRHEDYGIDAKDLESIIFGITELLFISLKRAEMGRERDAVSKNYSIVESHVSGGQQQGRSIIPFMGK